MQKLACYNYSILYELMKKAQIGFLDKDQLAVFYLTQNCHISVQFSRSVMYNSLQLHES